METFIVIETFGGLIDSAEVTEYPSFADAEAYIATRPAPKDDGNEYLIIGREARQDGRVSFSVDSYTESHCDCDGPPTLWPDACE